MLDQKERPLYPPTFLADLTLKTLEVLKEQIPAEAFRVVESLVVINIEQKRCELTDQFMLHAVSELLWFTAEQEPAVLEMKVPA